MTQYYFNQFLVWSPQIFTFLFIILICLSYFFKGSLFLIRIGYQRLVYFLLGLSFLYGAFLSLVQFLVWRSNAFSLFFLPPYQPWSYFISYSFFHFFLANIITLFTSFFVYLIFKIFQKYKPEFINNQSLALLFLACLLSAWPTIIIFLAFFLGASVILSVFNLLVYKKQEMDWFFPIIISLLLSFFTGNYLLLALNLGVLKI